MDIHFNRTMSLELRLGFHTLLRANTVLRACPRWAQLWDLGLITWITLSEYHIKVDEETTGLLWDFMLEIRTALVREEIAFELQFNYSQI